jgi:hypothetical protein
VEVFARVADESTSFSPLNAQGKDTLLETLEVAFERLEME